MRIVLLFSGGLNSVAMLKKAVADGHEIFGLFINYGQISSNKELEIFKHYKKYFKETQTPFINIPWYSGGLVNEKIQPTRRGEYHRKNILGNNYIPFRNGLLLSFAYSYADDINASQIWMGLNNKFENPYPDSNHQRLTQHTVTARKLSFLKAKLIFPFRSSDIFDVYEEYILGDFIRYWDCHKGLENFCGKCDRCLDLIDSLGKPYFNKTMKQISSLG